MDSEEIQTTSVSARQILQWAAIAAGLFVIAALVMFGVVYHRVSKQVDERLAAGPFQNAVTYYAAPEVVSVGDAVSPAELTEAIKRFGVHFTAKENSVGAQ